MPDDDLRFCAQCQGDFIGAPGQERCGTCGLPKARQVSQPVPATKTVPPPVKRRPETKAQPPAATR